MELDAWDRMEKSDLVALVEDFNKDRVSCVGDPIKGDPMVFVRVLTMPQPEIFIASLETLMREHFAEHSPSTLSDALTTT